MKVIKALKRLVEKTSNAIVDQVLWSMPKLVEDSFDTEAEAPVEQLNKTEKSGELSEEIRKARHGTRAVYRPSIEYGIPTEYGLPTGYDIPTECLL